MLSVVLFCKTVYLKLRPLEVKTEEVLIVTGLKVAYHSDRLLVPWTRTLRLREGKAAAQDLTAGAVELLESPAG